MMNQWEKEWEQKYGNYTIEELRELWASFPDDDYYNHCLGMWIWIRIDKKINEG